MLGVGGMKWANISVGNGFACGVTVAGGRRFRTIRTGTRAAEARREPATAARACPLPVRQER
jgi:hypothetical protein